jgi:hypothetical protein
MAVPSSGAEFLCKQKKKPRRGKKVCSPPPTPPQSKISSVVHSPPTTLSPPPQHRGFNPAADTVFSANGHASSVRVVAQQTVKPPVRGGSRFWSSGKPSGPPLGLYVLSFPRCFYVTFCTAAGLCAPPLPIPFIRPRYTAANVRRRYRTTPTTTTFES